MTPPVARFSDLKSILRSPAHYLHAAERTGPDHDHYRLGRAVHALVLQGIWPTTIKGARRSSADHTDALGHGATEDCLRMAESVSLHSGAQAWLAEAATREQEATAKLMGVDCAGRPDAVGLGLVVELKTTRDASPMAFERDLNRLMYGAQLSWYAHLLGMPTATRIVIAVENHEPFAVACYELHGRDDFDRSQWQKLLERYKEAQASGYWGAYGSGTLQIGLPPWADGEFAEEDPTTDGE